MFFQIFSFLEQTAAVVQRCSVKKAFLKILQNSQENTCARISFLIKLQASGLTYRTPLVWWLLLNKTCTSRDSMWNNLTKYNFFDFVIHWVIYLNSIFIITSSLLKSFGFLRLLVSRNLFYNHRDNYGPMTRRQPHSTDVECTSSNYFDPKVNWSLARRVGPKSRSIESVVFE